jgi:hypothetical protein
MERQWFGRLGAYEADNVCTCLARVTGHPEISVETPQATAGELGAKPVRHSRLSCRQRLVSVSVDGLCLVRYKRAGSEAQDRSRRAAGRKPQARELDDLSYSCDNKSTAEIG